MRADYSCRIQDGEEYPDGIYSPPRLEAGHISVRTQVTAASGKMMTELQIKAGEHGQPYHLPSPEEIRQCPREIAFRW